MTAVKAVTYAILLWFGAFLAMFLCITVLNAVVTGLAGANHHETMVDSYKAYSGISGFIATVLALIHINENKEQIFRTSENGDQRPEDNQR